MNNPRKGLSEENINLITGLVFFTLLIWGPINSNELAIRIIYLIAVPAAVWLILNFVGRKWNAGKAENDRLQRAIAGILAGALLIGAVLLYHQPIHSECTQYATSPDGGSECVGDYAPSAGPDIAEVAVTAGLGFVALWYSAFRKDDH